MTPFDDFAYLVNHVVLGEEPSIEDFILLVGTLVAFVAFILWCCFPITPKQQQEASKNNPNRQFTCISAQHTFTYTTVHHNPNCYSKKPFHDGDDEQHTHQCYT